MHSFDNFKRFIGEAKTPYHTVAAIKRRLLDEGYAELSASDSFTKPGKYFITKNQCSLIAFRVGNEKRGFMISATHCDTPTLKVKAITERQPYLQLATEKYGGSIHYSWLDRPLSVAGRVVVSTDDGISTRLFDADTDLVTIPSLAIHLNRSVNEGAKHSPLDDLQPLLSLADEKTTLEELIADSLGVDKNSIVSHDLFLYNREDARLFGKNRDLVLSPRLDDIECTYAALEAFVSSDAPTDSVPVLAVFNHEEIGSSTAEGAASTFLADTLYAIAGDDVSYRRMLAASFNVSADNAHAKHPNHPELSDRVGAPILGGGVVVKYNANRKYATDAVSDGILRILARRSGAKLQSFYSRPDLVCGSTLGSIASTRVSILTVDVGLAQLAMHSATESAAYSDIAELITLFSSLFASSLIPNGDSFTVLTSPANE